MNTQSLQKTCQLMVDILKVDHSAVLLFAPEHESVTVAAEYPRTIAQAPGLIPLSDFAVIHDYLKGKNSLLVDDIQSHRSLGSLGDLLLDWGIRSTLLAPLAKENQVIGLCTANAIRHPRGFTFEEIQYGEAFAAQASTGIENLHLQAENKRYKARWERLMDSTPSAIVEIDAKGNVTGCNEQAWQVLGYKAADEMPRDVRDLYFYPTEPYEIGKRLHANGYVTNYETLAKSKSGAPIPIRISVRHLLDEHYQRVWSIGNFQDLRLINEAEKRFDLLWKASDAPVDSSGLTNWFERLSEMLLSLFPHTFCQIALLDDTQSFLKVKASVVGAAYQDTFAWTPNTECPIDVSRWLGLEEALYKGDPIHLHWSDGGSRGKLLGYSRQLQLEGDIQSLLVVPLKIGARPLGLFNFGEMLPENEVVFSRGEVSRVASLTPQIADLIDRAILAQKKAKLVEQLNRSNAAAQHIARVSARGDIQTTLQAVTEETCKALECDAITLYVHDLASKNISNPPKMCGVRNPEGLKRFNSLPENSIVWNILKQEEPYVIKDISEDPLFKGSRFARDEGIRSCVAVPLTTAGQPVGVMFINYRTAHQFHSDELATVKHFANQAAVAIYNAQLFEQAQKQTKALEALYETGRIVSGSLDPEEILRRVGAQAWGLTHDSTEKVRGSADVWLVENNRIHLIAEYPESPQASFHRSIDLSWKRSEKIGIIGRAARLGKSQLVNDVSQDRDYWGHYPKTSSELAVPILIDGRVVGVINIERPNLNAFHAEDEQVLVSLAAQASIALQNARQHEELNKTRGQLAIKTAIALMGIDIAESGHATLTEATTIRDLVALINRDFYSDAPIERIRERIKSIDAIAARVQESLRHAPLSPEEGKQSVLVNDFVHGQLDQLTERLRSCNGTPVVVNLRREIDLLDHYSVRGNPRWLTRVFNLIVNNALEAVADVDQPVVTITTKFMDGGIGVLVSDTGRGIPDNVRQNFLKAPVKPARGSKGLGMGALLAQEIVQTYGGDLRLGSTGPHGTTIVMWLPAEPLACEESQNEGEARETNPVLLIGDCQESEWVKAIRDALAPSRGLEIIPEQEVLWHLRRKQYAAVLLDAETVRNPLSLTEQICALESHTTLFVAAESRKWRLARELFRSGAADCISRPECPEELRSILNGTFTQSSLHVELSASLGAGRNSYHHYAN